MNLIARPKRLFLHPLSCDDAVETVVNDRPFYRSLRPKQVARQVAGDCVPDLKPGQVYLDLNSTAPFVKVELAKIIAPSGADFVEGALLGAVGATGAKTPLLVGGLKGPIVAEMLVQLGLNVTPYSSEIGQASMFKMLRSIFSKGLEALVLEFLIAGTRAGIASELWDEAVTLTSTARTRALASGFSHRNLTDSGPNLDYDELQVLMSV